MDITKIIQKAHKNMSYGQNDLPLREHLLEQVQYLRDIQLHIFKVQEMLVVFLLCTDEPATRAKQADIQTFSSKSSILRSISRMAFSRPL